MPVSKYHIIFMRWFKTVAMGKVWVHLWFGDNLSYNQWIQLDHFFCWVGVSPYKEFCFLKGSFGEITMKVWKDYKKSSDLEKRPFRPSIGGRRKIMRFTATIMLVLQQ